jgi:hypothetical protein
MVYTMRDFRRDYIKEHLPKLTPEERQDVLRVVPREEIVASLTAEQILASFTAEEIVAGLSPDADPRVSEPRGRWPQDPGAPTAPKEIEVDRPPGPIFALPKAGILYTLSRTGFRTCCEPSSARSVLVPDSAHAQGHRPGSLVLL